MQRNKMAIVVLVTMALSIGLTSGCEQVPGLSSNPQTQDKSEQQSAEPIVTTIAGDGSVGDKDGPALTASFNNPARITVGINGDIYVHDQGNGKIKKISIDGTVSTISKSHSVSKWDIDVDNSGNLVTRLSGIGICKITPYGEIVSMPKYGSMLDIFRLGTEGVIYTAGSTIDGVVEVRKLYPDGGVSTLISSDDTWWLDYQFIAVDLNENVFVSEFNMLDRSNRICKISRNGVVSVVADVSESWDYNVIDVDSDGNLYFIAIHKEDPVTHPGPFNPGTDHPPTGGNTSNRYAIASSSQARKSEIRKITTSGEIFTIVGAGDVGHQDGVLSNAKFESFYALAVDPSGDLIVADKERIRKISFPKAK